MNLISIFGAGLLVGAALIVVIPEGMLVLAESLLQKDLALHEQEHHDHSHDDHHHEEHDDHASNTSVLAGLVLHSVDTSGSILPPKTSTYVGLSIIIGFTIMLALDQSFAVVQEFTEEKPQDSQTPLLEEGLSPTT
eukprot:CAMPEP_0170560948 /NCGR_PEP_ID=MMETSP0211-20121228/51883_1 /TAXON_ID=311385 /ORGANISM="Pseudokeronopsis sp., Strain OXSARD2" /LENGTH=135 /DNA_ID=CAMNT_0010875833 /DNA_START=65 /DNA_END=472 /DNA_ORIENTATION=+